MHNLTSSVVHNIHLWVERLDLRFGILAFFVWSFSFLSFQRYIVFILFHWIFLLLYHVKCLFFFTVVVIAADVDVF